MPAKKTGVLKIDDLAKLPLLDKLLKKKNIVIVLVYADWCPACRRFKKDVWGPACEKEAVHERAEVEASLVDKSPALKNAKFQYLPSVLVVDEKGEVQEFETPEGKTNAMPTPKSEEEMTRIMNVNVAPAANTKVVNTFVAPPPSMPKNTKVPVGMSLQQQPAAAQPTPTPKDQENLMNISDSIKTPPGLVYTPSPAMVSPTKSAPAAAQLGGGLFRSLLQIAGGARKMSKTRHKLKRSSRKKLTRRNRRQ